MRFEKFEQNDNSLVCRRRWLLLLRSSWSLLRLTTDRAAANSKHLLENNNSIKLYNRISSGFRI